jgi:hypothetical protein
LADEESEDEKASRREDRACGCGLEAVGCGCEGVLAMILIPAAILLFLR